MITFDDKRSVKFVTALVVRDGGAWSWAAFAPDGRFAQGQAASKDGALAAVAQHQERDACR